MKTIKLNNEQAKLVLLSISACIREETRDMVIAESKGYKTKSYEQRLSNLKELKECINNQIQ